MDMMQYLLCTAQSCDSNVFNLEIFMQLGLRVDQSLEKPMKSWEKLSKTGTLAVTISVRN